MQVEQARHQKSRHLFLAVLGATTLGCGGGHLSISNPPGPPVYQENEPNDFLYFPDWMGGCLLYTSPSPRDATLSRMPSSA